ncbi:MAG: GNAT family N-acetyltransferase [Acidobacteriia bacterium]|nr:GNAT family N-acetyltransferase [Terriglobia bacterium]
MSLVADLKIEVTRTAEPELRGLIACRLQEYNAPFLGDHPFGTLDVFVRRVDGELAGGLVGEFAFGWLSIHVFWLEERLRGMGIGTAVLNAAEAEAIGQGCRFAIVETMSFQAPGFYEKRGYVRVGVVDGYPGGSRKIFMRKALRPEH